VRAEDWLALPAATAVAAAGIGHVVVVVVVGLGSGAGRWGLRRSPGLAAHRERASGFCWQNHVVSVVDGIKPVAAPICSYRTF
jgi:hypothetical protein